MLDLYLGCKVKLKEENPHQGHEFKTQYCQKIKNKRGKPYSYLKRHRKVGNFSTSICGLNNNKKNPVQTGLQVQFADLIKSTYPRPTTSGATAEVSILKSGIEQGYQRSSSC
jgi:hypothetical protein